MQFGIEIFIIEVIGIIAFTISGVMVAFKKRLDLLGVVTLGTLTAVGGGALRDILLGILPPSMFKNGIYVLLAFLTAIISFYIGILTIKKIKRKREEFYNLITFFDAVGLGVFTVVGSNTAIINGFGDNAFLTIFVGVITGVGGGVIRDVIANTTPFIMYKDLYASSAIIGAALYYALYQLHSNSFLCISISIIATILVRLIAHKYHLGLPKFGVYKDREE
jgi:uncharacterized membrane protein YeiH